MFQLRSYAKTNVFQSFKLRTNTGKYPLFLRAHENPYRPDNTDPEALGDLTCFAIIEHKGSLLLERKGNCFGFPDIDKLFESHHEGCVLRSLLHQPRSHASEFLLHFRGNENWFKERWQEIKLANAF